MMPGNGLISDCIEKAYPGCSTEGHVFLHFCKENLFWGMLITPSTEELCSLTRKDLQLWCYRLFSLPFVPKSNLQADRNRRLLLKWFPMIPWNTTGRAYRRQVQCGTWVRGIKALREIFLWLIQILVYVHIGGLWNEAFFLDPFVVYANILNSHCSIYLLIMTSSTCLRIRHWRRLSIVQDSIGPQNYYLWFASFWFLLKKPLII